MSDFLRYVADTLDLVSLTQDGAKVMVNIRDQLQDLDPDSDTRDRAIGARAALAESELNRDFPLLNGHALMGLWGALEACVDDVCVGWLMESGGTGARESMQRVRVSLADIYFLTEPDRSRRLLEWIKASLGSDLKHGAGQFESALGAIGVGGVIDPNIRTLLLYAKELRNVVAHRGGRVDERVLELGADIVDAPLGEPLRISTAQMFALSSAMVVYAEGLRHRVQVAGDETADGPGLPPWVTSTEQLLQDFKSRS